MSEDVRKGRSAQRAREPVAGFERRLAARAIDALVGVVVAAVMVFAFVKAGAMAAPESDGPGIRAAFLVGLAGMVAYNTVAVALCGATLGKAYCELRVRNEERGACSWGEAFVREAFAVIDGGLLPITYFVMRGSNQQRWGDRFAGTVVVRVAKPGSGSQAGALRLGIAASLVVAIAAGAEVADVLARAQETATCDHPEGAEFRDTCLAKLAVKANKPSLCERSATSHGREECYAHLAPGLGPAWCDKVDTRDLRERCYASSAREAALCAKIDDNDRLREQCIAKVVSKTHDPRLCDGLKLLHDLCVAELGPAKPADDECVSFTAPPARDACYAQHGMCDLVQAPPTRDHCYVANAKGPSDCTKVTAQVALVACFTAAAGASQDPSLCDKIGDGVDNPARRLCYSKAYATTATPTLCARFTDTPTQQDCFATAASVAHDASVCSRIADVTKKKDCVQRANAKP